MAPVLTRADTEGPELVCPACASPLVSESDALACDACSSRYAKHDGVWVLAPDLQGVAEDYDPAYYPRLAAVEAKSFWFRNRNRMIQDAVRSHFGDRGALLEIGCGTGFVLAGLAKALPDWTLYGSEVHVEGLAFARERVPRARFYQIDARCIPFRSAFDVIGAFDVIEHIEEDTRVLSAIHAALRPGGGLVLTVPQHPWLWTEVDALSGHKRRYTAAELTAKVEAAGFEILHTTSFVSLLLPAIYLSRALNKSRTHTMDDVMRQFDIPWVLDAVLSKVLDAERGLLGLTGTDLPLGSSRLLVARARA